MRIKVDGHYIFVTEGYLHREFAYAKKELRTFFSLPEGPEKAEARQVLLDKRDEFYRLETNQDAYQTCISQSEGSEIPAVDQDQAHRGLRPEPNGRPIPADG